MNIAKNQALLLVNLGTPSDATPSAIKNYLSEFLRDRYVVDLNPLIWLPILHGIVIPKRLNYITEHYQHIWLNDQSPLLYYSNSLCKKISQANPDMQCELAMTYGEPNLSAALQRLKSFKTINVLFLYPQYSTATTLAAQTKIEKIVKQWSIQPKLNYLHDYAEHPAYIDALFEQVKQALVAQSQPNTLLLSYHGIPIRYIKKRGDNYASRCELTTQKLCQKLRENNIEIDVIMTYQSRFGKGEWTTPNTSEVLVDLAKSGKKSVYVMCPGFAVDCLETLYEIDVENREIFQQAGGEHFVYIPALNDSDLHTSMQTQLINDYFIK